MADKEQLLERIQSLTHHLTPISVDHETRLAKLEGIECVAFDFYGTMFISAVGEIGIDEEQEIDSARYFTRALKDTGFSILGEQAGQRGTQLFEEIVELHVQSAKKKGIDVPEPMITSVWRDVLTALQEEGLAEGRLTPEIARLFGIEFEMRINDVWPLPELESTLQEIMDRGLKLGIISNSQYYTPLTFEALLGVSPAEFGFDPNLLIWSYETGYKKPSSTFYQHFVDAAGQQALQPGQVLYVGNDIRKDIQPAKKAGMKTALYIGDKRSVRHEPHHLQQDEFSADLVIDDLSQILDCL